ncbi:hypothetical protein PPERSA_12978 [Pseudocohnilembus persalinus]|uniref:Uncharacterized protein n=1 Tax=Pseudocohnilembus persalinus TaxID=266149 RepID=A0A0V0R1Y4_PSEPJ|nr:hypothetical protein PPERSA_12978 [Pseudocohnilembus persalinus]|eukprot:KRX08497.1 hypothetical protein PPERSA_12978 [Pseudocohnilembus persalinus]
MSSSTQKRRRTRQERCSTNMSLLQSQREHGDKNHQQSQQLQTQSSNRQKNSNSSINFTQLEKADQNKSQSQNQQDKQNEKEQNEIQDEQNQNQNYYNNIQSSNYTQNNHVMPPLSANKRRPFKIQLVDCSPGKKNTKKQLENEIQHKLEECNKYDRNQSPDSPSKMGIALFIDFFKIYNFVFNIKLYVLKIDAFYKEYKLSTAKKQELKSSDQKSEENGENNLNTQDQYKRSNNFEGIQNQDTLASYSKRTKSRNRDNLNSTSAFQIENNSQQQNQQNQQNQEKIENFKFYQAYSSIHGSGITIRQ